MARCGSTCSACGACSWRWRVLGPRCRSAGLPSCKAECIVALLSAEYSTSSCAINLGIRSAPPLCPLQALQHRKTEDDTLPRLPAGLRTALWQQRLEQQHFVNNMMLYLTMDVVDASFRQLRTAIASARDFSAADAAHRAYVDGLVSQVCVCVCFWCVCVLQEDIQKVMVAAHLAE